MAPLPSPESIRDMSGVLHDIYNRGYLIAGVDDNTPGFSSRDPNTNEITGLEVSIVHEIAKAIFGPDDLQHTRVRLKTVVTAQKVPFVQDGRVDLTVSAVSMTCDRWKKVDFSTEYFTAAHKLLVPKGSALDPGDPPTYQGVNLDNLGEVLRDKRVCVTKGSSSVKLLTEHAPGAKLLQVDARSDCLMRLQQGRADAYFGHDSFMFGVADQDPTVAIVPDAINDQHYGIAIQKGHEDLTTFVNGVLARMRDPNNETTLLGLYKQYLGEKNAPKEVPPADERRPFPPSRAGAQR
jgi:polar amino acid transport system substrate-binding protein